MKQKYNKFLHILFELVSDEATDHLVRWNSEDEDCGFTIIDPKEFEKQILPLHFKKSNLFSFLRQLNMYDFDKKNKRQRDWKVYYHSYFKKDDKELLVKIKRKESNKNEESTWNVVPERLEKEYVQSNLSTMSTEYSMCPQPG